MEFIEFLKQSTWGEALITFVVAMIPVIELRGAIPIGVGLGLHPWTAMAISVVGNMVPVPFIIIFIRRIFAWMCKKSEKLGSLVKRLESRAEGKWEKVHKYEILGLIILVAIPLPGTGAWTGSLIAALLGMRLKRVMPAVFIGVLIAGFIVTGITYGFTAIF